jgi:hypothetical protein
MPSSAVMTPSTEPNLPTAAEPARGPHRTSPEARCGCTSGIRNGFGAFEQNNRPMRALRECRGLGEQASIYERGREVSIRLPLDHDAAVDEVVADRKMRHVAALSPVSKNPAKTLLSDVGRPVPRATSSTILTAWVLARQSRAPACHPRTGIPSPPLIQPELSPPAPRTESAGGRCRS